MSEENKIETEAVPEEMQTEETKAAVEQMPAENEAEAPLENGEATQEPEEIIREEEIPGEEEFSEDEQSEDDYVEYDGSEYEEYEEAGEYEEDEEFDETGFFTDIKQLISEIVLHIRGMDKKVLRKKLFIYVPIFVLVMLILTDIIPILPNSYNRSYVGNTHALGETQGNDYKAYGKDVLYVANGTLQCFGPDMKEKVKINTFTGIPVLKINKNGAIVYSKNGNDALVMTSVDKYSLKTSEERILSASVSPDGAYILVTAEAGYTSKLSAYDTSDECIYKWHTNSSIIDTGIFANSKNLVAASVEYDGTDVYSKLHFFDVTSSGSPKEVKLENNLITELYVSDKDTVIAFGTDYTCAYTPSGVLKWTIEYDGKLLKSFDVSDEGNIAFLFNKYNSALSESRIEIYKTNGRRTGAYNSELNVRAISVNNDYCLLSHDSETTLLDNDGDVKKIKTVDYEFTKGVLYQNYNFAFSINNSVAETMSVRH